MPLWYTIQSIIARAVLRVAFAGLVSAQRARTRPVPAGVLPLPWLGPKGETVVVVLDEAGRMVCAPVLCETPQDMIAVMAAHRRPPTRNGPSPVRGPTRVA
jgi:hypothetical protein